MYVSYRLLFIKMSKTITTIQHFNEAGDDCSVEKTEGIGRF